MLLPHTPSRLSTLLLSFPRLRLRHGSLSTLASLAPHFLPAPSSLPPPNSTILTALSGGVDSSVTLALLHHLAPAYGWDLRGVFMRNWMRKESEEAYDGEGCEWERDWEDVRRVCGVLDVPCSMVDLSTEYWLRVFEPSIHSWSTGQTPNPDVSCNREIKFGVLMDKLLPKTPNSFLATGHYASLLHSPSTEPQTRLLRSADPAKDQTYYLSSVPESQLARAIFPLSHLTKPQVRSLARHFHLPTAERAESMGVCFVGERGGRGRFGEFVSQYLPSSPSSGVAGSPNNTITTLSGTVLGTHRGLHRYTIGQRARLPGLDGRWFVARKVVAEGGAGGRVVIVPGADHPALLCTSLTTSSFHWIHSDPPPAIEEAEGLKAVAQVRHRMSAVPVRVHRVVNGGIEVRFDRPEKAVALGQVIAIWVEVEEGGGKWDWCLGSGVISGTRCLDEKSV